LNGIEPKNNSLSRVFISPHISMSDLKTGEHSPDSGAAVKIRCFKNRNLGQIPGSALSEIWDGYFWCSAEGVLIRRPDLDPKAGKGKVMWEMKITEPPHPYPYDRVVPSKTTAIIMIGNAFHHFNFSYKTVSVKPCPASGGFVLINLAEDAANRAVDTSDLKMGIWVVGPESEPRFVLRLKKMLEFDAAICKDDVTGEAYPYVLEGLYVAMKAP
jgi:hypothetical protein